MAEKEIVITCVDCGFVVPKYAVKQLQRDEGVRVDVFVCPTCDAAFQVSVQTLRKTKLSSAELEAVRNRNR